jgi:hypothetical protein
MGNNSTANWFRKGRSEVSARFRANKGGDDLRQKKSKPAAAVWDANDGLRVSPFGEVRYRVAPQATHFQTGLAQMSGAFWNDATGICASGKPHRYGGRNGEVETQGN